jgi:hypothetical protein
MNSTTTSRTVLPLALAVLALAVPGHARTARLARSEVSGTVYKYETSHFAIFYQTAGPNAVYNATQVDASGVPVAIDSIGAFAERSWSLAVDTLGFKAPVGISNIIYYAQAVPAGKMPIEVADIGYANTDAPWNNSEMSFSTDPSLDPQGLGSEIILENDFLYGSPAKPIQVAVDQAPNGILYDFSQPQDIYKGWKVSVSHELFRTVTFSYGSNYLYAFHTMSAAWFAIRAYPEIHFHWTYLKAFVTNAYAGAFEQGSTGLLPYEDHVFAMELVHLFGDDCIRKLWEFVARGDFSTTVPNYDESSLFSQALDSLGYSQIDLVKDYSVQMANLVTNKPGVFNDSGQYIYPFAMLHIVRVVPGMEKWDGLTVGSGNFGVDQVTLTWDSLPKMNLQINRVPTTAPAVGFLVHVPSLKTEQFHTQIDSAVFAFDPADTAISVFAVGGYFPAGWYIATQFTTASSTSLARKGVHPTLFRTTRRSDIFGRPLSPEARGLIIESDGVKTVPAIQLK